MTKPTIVYGIPIIATKDGAWINQMAKNTKAVPGAIWLLPEDAILIMPPQTPDITIDPEETN